MQLIPNIIFEFCQKVMFIYHMSTIFGIWLLYEYDFYREAKSTSFEYRTSPIVGYFEN